MANPNLNSATNVYLNNAFVRLTSTSETQVLSNAASSSKAFLVDSIVASNVDGTNAADVTINLYAAATNSGTATKVAHVITVPAKATLIVVSKDFGLSLLESQSIYATASASNAIHVTAYWKELS
ncbi:hypothetical protein EBZ39_09795 [bacterium]|nr:hypothetical protein [bacterium]